MLTRSDLLTVRDYFSGDEWDLIDAALSEYQDHFDTDEDAIVLNTLQSKLAGLFRINADATDWESALYVTLNHHSLIMRKIETLMNKAIENGNDWSLDNTQVRTVDDVAHVYLHGNLISKIGEGWIQLFDGGWQSKTTKSRLNAILLENGLPGECVFQRNHQWFVNYNGSPIPFFSGMRMNWKSSALQSYSAVDCPIIVITTHTLLMHTQEFMNACYNLIDLKIIDLDEYQGFLDNFTTTEELDAYLTAREDISFWYIMITNVATASRLDLEIADTRGQIKYTRLKPQSPRRSLLVLTQTKGLRTNTNRGKINNKHATLVWYDYRGVDNTQSLWYTDSR